MFLLVIAMAASVSSCSPLNRSKKAIVVDDYGSMRYIKGRQDRVHKKWKNTYTPKNNKVAKRKYADW